MKSFIRGPLVLLLGIPSILSADYLTIKEERSYADPPTGDWVTNGVITPLDQEMRNFYARNADGAIEVLLKEDVQIGLQSRVQRGGFEERKVEFTMGGKRFSFDLPKNLYVKRTFKDAEAVRKWEERGRRPIFDGKLYLEPIADHLPSPGNHGFRGNSWVKTVVLWMCKSGRKSFRSARRVMMDNTGSWDCSAGRI